MKSSVRVLTFVPDNLGALIVSDRRLENLVSVVVEARAETTYFIGHVSICQCIYHMYYLVCVDDCQSKQSERDYNHVLRGYYRKWHYHNDVVHNCQLCISFT